LSPQGVAPRDRRVELGLRGADLGRERPLPLDIGGRKPAPAAVDGAADVARTRGAAFLLRGLRGLQPAVRPRDVLAGAFSARQRASAASASGLRAAGLPPAGAGGGATICSTDRAPGIGASP